MNLENTKHLKEVETILDNWNEHKGDLVINDYNGVDLIVPIDIEKLNLKTNTSDTVALLKEHYEDSVYSFEYDPNGFNEIALSVSSSEEIFVTPEGTLCFPDDASSITLSKDNREIEILAHSLDWMHNSGITCSIYELDYNGSPSLLKYAEWEAYKMLSDDEEKQKTEIERLLEIITCNEYLNNNLMHIGSIPAEFYDVLPPVLQENDGYLEVLDIVGFDTFTMTLDIEVTEAHMVETADLEAIKKLSEKNWKSKYGACFRVRVSILPNSIRFLKGLDSTT